MEKKDNLDKDIEIIRTDIDSIDVFNIQELLQEIRDDGHIPIIHITKIEFVWDEIRKLSSGFEESDLQELLQVQLDYENYEGAAFIKEVIDERNNPIIE